MTLEIPILKAKNISKSYKTPHEVCIIKDISLQIMRGETIAILGPSGVGKSTLLNILGTLEQPTRGSLEISNKNTSYDNLDILRNHHIGFIFQSYHLLEEYTSLDNVLMPAKIGRKKTSSHSHAFQRAIMLLDRVGMAHRSSFLTKLLSGGEKQRIAIARALCNDPDIILADEPTGNLDEHNSRLIQTLLIECAKEFHKALIVVTHHQELAKLCDKRFLLKEGILQSIE
jgi:lipoprotein-releasing system ATP-binding protein